MAGIATRIRERRERTAARAAGVAYRRQEQALLTEEREAERRNRALWRRIKIKMPKEAAPERKPHRPTRSGFLHGASPLPSYSGAIVDRLGRRSVFVRIRYYGRKSTRPGVGRRLATYIYQGAVENDDGTVCLFSNVADSPQEAIAAMELIEQINREASVDAKLLFHLIANLPHQLTLDQMMEEARRFAEAQFGSRDLPYVVALHAPSAQGDQRNWHVHILASTRPMRRIGDHEWELGEQLRTEIDNPEAFRRMRELYAAIQTEVAQEAGLDLAYTALSNAARGLPNKPQEHLGGSLTDLVRRGEVVAANERNRGIVVEGEQALLDERLRHEQEASSREAALIARAVAPFAQNAVAPKLAIAVPGSAAVSNLKQEPLASRTGRAASRASTSTMIVPLAVAVPASRSGLPAISDVQLPKQPSPDVATLSAAASLSPAVSNLKAVPASETSLPQASITAEPLPSITSASRSDIPTTAIGSVMLPQADLTMPTVAPMMKSVPASAMIASRTLELAEGGVGLVPITADRAVSLSRLPPRQVSSVTRPPHVSSGVPTPQASADLALSRSPGPQRSTLTVSDMPRVIAPVSAVPDADLDAARRLIEMRRAQAKRRKAEPEASAVAAARVAEEAAEHAAVQAAEQDDLERLRALDPLVNEFRRKGLSVPDEFLTELGRDVTWERTAPVQQALAAMLDDQNARLDRMVSAPDGTAPVTMVNGQLVPAPHLASDLARSIERWSNDRVFRALASKLWPAPPPTASSGSYRSVLQIPAIVSPDDDVERSRRWAAAYREHLMEASDVLQRWDGSGASIRSNEERVEVEKPARAPVNPAAFAARHIIDRGRGG